MILHGTVDFCGCSQDLKNSLHVSLFSLSALLKSSFGNVCVESDDFFRKSLPGGDSLFEVAILVY